MTSLFSSKPGIVRVANVMVREPATVGFWTPLRVAAELLEHAPSDALLVLYEDGRLAGLLTERELVLGAQLEAEGLPGNAGHYASLKFVFAWEQESLEALMRRMVTQGARRAVVLDGEGSPVGLVSVLMGLSADAGEVALARSTAEHSEHMA